MEAKAGLFEFDSFFWCCVCAQDKHVRGAEFSRGCRLFFFSWHEKQNWTEDSLCLVGFGRPIPRSDSDVIGESAVGFCACCSLHLHEPWAMARHLVWFLFGSAPIVFGAPPTCIGSGKESGHIWPPQLQHFHQPAFQLNAFIFRITITNIHTYIHTYKKPNGPKKKRRQKP